MFPRGAKAATTLVFMIACVPSAVPSNTSYRFVECSKSPIECFDALRRSCPEGFLLLSEEVTCGIYSTPLVPGPVPWYSFEASCYPSFFEPEPPYNPCYIR